MINSKIIKIASNTEYAGLKNEFTQVITLPIEESYENQLYNNFNIFIDEQKRVFDGEIHYFDHPSFGIVISIEKI